MLPAWPAADPYSPAWTVVGSQLRSQVKCHAGVDQSHVSCWLALLASASLTSKIQPLAKQAWKTLPLHQQSRNSLSLAFLLHIFATPKKKKEKKIFPLPLNLNYFTISLKPSRKYPRDETRIAKPTTAYAKCICIFFLRVSFNQCLCSSTITKQLGKHSALIYHRNGSSKSINQGWESLPCLAVPDLPSMVFLHPSTQASYRLPPIFQLNWPKRVNLSYCSSLRATKDWT